MNPNYNQPQPAMNPGIDRFTEMHNRGKENLVITGFVLSIIGIVIAFFGVALGGIVVFFEMYCGIQGVHSRKKGLAITTIVLASISFAVLVVAIVLRASQYGYY